MARFKPTRSVAPHKKPKQEFPFYVVVLDCFGKDSKGMDIALHTVFGAPSQPVAMALSSNGPTSPQLYRTRKRQPVDRFVSKSAAVESALAKAGAPDTCMLVCAYGTTEARYVVYQNIEYSQKEK